MLDLLQITYDTAGETRTSRLVFLDTRKISLEQGWEPFHKRFVEPPWSGRFLVDVR